MLCSIMETAPPQVSMRTSLRATAVAAKDTTFSRRQQRKGGSASECSLWLGPSRAASRRSRSLPNQQNRSLTRQSSCQLLVATLASQ